MILIIAADIEEDMPLYLYNFLKEKDEDIVYIGQNTLPFQNTVTFYPQNGKFEGVININGTFDLDISEIKAVYLRTGFSELEEDFTQEEKQYIESQRQITLNALFEHLDSMVINRTKAQFFNSSKLFQSWIIQKYGFKIPKSIISNNPEKVKEFIKLHQNTGVIYKSASAERSVVKKFNREDFEKLDFLINCPHLFQECVNGDDIRVHALVTGETFACKIKSETSDYRYDKERSIVPVELPDDIAKQCVKLTGDLGLYLSGIDLRLTDDGNYYCFEVNPSPAFTWYEDQTGLPITEAVGNMMLNAQKYKNLAIRKF